jgi:hypothetical protein
MTGRMTVSEQDLTTLAGMITEHRTDIPTQGEQPATCRPHR